MKSVLRILGLFAILGMVLFAAVTPAKALIPGQFCTNPWFAMLNDGKYFENECKPAGQGQNVDPNNPNPGHMDLFDGFVHTTIYGVPGVQFKAFMYQVVPTPKNVPDGWYVVGYGVDIFYDDANVNPEGLVCFKIPDGYAANYSVGVYGFDGTDYYLINTGTCGYFQGGGQFFLLIKGIDPLQFMPGFNV